MSFEENEIQILESEKNNSESNFSVNPWDVLNASDFLKYCCPECDFKSGELLAFSQHAIINHVLSSTLFNNKNSLIDCDIENDKNPDVNSNEAKLELEDDTLFDTKTKSFESNIDTLVEHEETMEPDMNTTINSPEAKSRNQSLNLDFPETTVNLENQSDSNEKKLEKKEALKSSSMKDLYHADICEICGFTSTTLQGLKSHVNMMHEKRFNSITNDGIPEKKAENTIEKSNMLKMDLSENTLFGGRNLTALGKLIVNDRNPNVNSYEFEEHIDNPLHDIKSESFVEREETMKLEPNIEISSSDGSNLENQFEICGKKIVDKGTYICENCGFTADTLGRIKRHVDVMHQNNIDGKVLKDDEQVQNPDITDQLCAKCGQHFTSLIDLVHHFFKEHKKLGEDFDCPKCPKIISTKYQGSKHYVMEHIRNTHLKETKKCPDCKQILKLSCFKRHRQIVHGICAKKGDTNPMTTIAPNPDDGYECPDCKKILLTKGSKYTLIACPSGPTIHFSFFYVPKKNP